MKKSLVLAMAMALGVTASAYAANPLLRCAGRPLGV